VEGIGYDFIPSVLNRDVVDEWVKTDDKESFQMARKLIREEGLLVGGSCETAMVGALKAAKKLKKGQVCVVVFPDSVRNYMTKFLTDEWMIDHGFMEPTPVRRASLHAIPFEEATVTDLKLPKAVVVKEGQTLKECVEICEKGGFDQLHVVMEIGKIVGLITLGNILSKVARNVVTLNDPVSKVAFTFGKGKSADGFVEITRDITINISKVINTKLDVSSS
jgi:cystathionine beta-synthase